MGLTELNETPADISDTEQNRAMFRVIRKFIALTSRNNACKGIGPAFEEMDRVFPVGHQDQSGGTFQVCRSEQDDAASGKLRCDRQSVPTCRARLQRTAYVASKGRWMR